MFNPTGTVTVNGIQDEELVKILEIKIKHEGSFMFNPQLLQPFVPRPNVPTEANQPPHYGNAVFEWKGTDGLEAVYSIISMLLKKEEHAETSTQVK